MKLSIRGVGGYEIVGEGRSISYSILIMGSASYNVVVSEALGMSLVEEFDDLKFHIAFSYCLPHWKCLETAIGFVHNTFKIQ